MKEILKELLHTKRIKYLGVVCVFVLFALILNITYSAFTASTNRNAANIIVGELEYATTLNGVSGDTITATANDITKINVGVEALNNMETKYELIYTICTDSNCTNTVSSVEGLTIEYSSRTIDTVKGNVDSNGNKTIRVVITNSTSTTYYIKIGINAGLSFNTLAYQDLITSEYNEEDLTIVTYVDGNLSNSFPTTEGEYRPSVQCTQADGSTSSTTGSVTWDSSDNKWKLSINNLITGETRCNVYFTPPQPLKNLILANNIVTSPLTTPGQKLSLYTLNDDTTEYSFSVSSSYNAYYYTYGTGVTNGTTSGKFTLTGVSKCRLSGSTCRDTLIGKYIVGNSYDTASSSSYTTLTYTNYGTNIYQITGISYYSSRNSYIYYKKANGSSEKKTYQKKANIKSCTHN